MIVKRNIFHFYLGVVDIQVDIQEDIHLVTVELALIIYCTMVS